MAKKLRVVVSDSDYEQIRRIARSRHMSVAEWVRQSLDAARRHETSSSVARKLAAVRAAVRHEFPACDIETMLDEIGGR